jgi:hypothetical protein
VLRERIPEEIWRRAMRSREQGGRTVPPSSMAVESNLYILSSSTACSSGKKSHETKRFHPLRLWHVVSSKRRGMSGRRPTRERIGRWLGLCRAGLFGCDGSTNRHGSGASSGLARFT